VFSEQHEWPDQDSDGIADAYEDRNGDGDLTNDDTDGDQRADYLDDDDDHDHVPTRQEDPNGNGQPLDDDSDGDGLPNYLDPDDDADIVPTRQEDANQNGDPTDDDRDQDTIPDYLDPAASGPGVGDSDNDGSLLHDGAECPAQPCRDSDNDGRPDYMDGDDDEDGLPTLDEALHSNAMGSDGNPSDDEDRDGVPNYLDPQEDVHRQSATLGDLIWLDADLDGVQDQDETGSSSSPFIQGVPGVMITLYDATTTMPVMTTQSDGVGRYRFVNVLPGHYFLEFTAPTGYDFTIADSGEDDSFDSDAASIATTVARSAVITVTSGLNNPTLDLGLHFQQQQGAGIGGQVWHDDNKNGLQDSAESGVAGVKITLFNQATAVVATMRSDSTGAYQFTNLLPGPYALAFTPPADYAVTTMRRGVSEIMLSELDPDIGHTPFSTLAPGEVDRSWRVGLSLAVAPAAIDGRAWYDLNRNGLQEAEEGTIAGVTVNLLTSRRQWLAGTTTNDEGRYRFDGLATGNYLIGVKAPAGYVISRRAQGTDSVDSDIYPSSGRTDLIMLLPAIGPVTRDVGLSIAGMDDANALTPVMLQGRVWEDQSRNGLQDSSEIGIEAAIVKLYSAQGELLHITKSDEHGYYHLINLPPGDYRLEFMSVEGHKITLVDQGTTDATDSDIDPNTGRTPLIRLQGGITPQRWDAGLYLQPTAITLAGFQAILQGDTLHIQWTTTAEMNTLGYHIVADTDGAYADSAYTDSTSDAVRLNQRLIMNQGSNGGAYAIDLPYNPAYDPPLDQIQLWLIEVTEDGTQSQWGPISVMRAVQFLPIMQR